MSIPIRAEDHLGLVYHVAGQVAIPSSLMENDDVIAEGMVGLVKAARNYDPAQGEFSTYAIHLIRGHILDGARRADWKSRRDRQHLNATAEERASFSVRVQRQLALMEGRTLVSLPWYASDESSKWVEEIADPSIPAFDDVVIQAEDRAELRRGLERLPARERAAIIGYVFHEETFLRIGADLGISSSRAFQLYQAALGRLRRMLGDAA